MKEYRIDLTQAVTATVLSLIILLSSTFVAQQVQKSSLYQQSKLYSSILSQESIGVLDIFSSRENLETLAKFVGAVTSAYINFELIPLNEARTFVAVFESTTEGVDVERFEYQRKDLVIYGTAADEESYQRYLKRLRDTGHFDSVSGHDYITTLDTVRFELYCTSTATANSEAFHVFAPLFICPQFKNTILV